MGSVYDKIKWDRIGQINTIDCNHVNWYYLYDHPKSYSKSKGLGLNAGEWTVVCMWHVKYKSLWQIIKQKIKSFVMKTIN